jgi:N-acetyl-alpha-D-muramate 1-phosphate uridylyltransferase
MNYKLKAMVLAAGLGKRMMPLTATIPKPMIEVCGRTLIDRALDFFANSDVNDVVVNSFYKAELLEAHLAKRQLTSPHAPNITVLREELLLETGGGILNALTHLGENPFFSANSDTICVDGTKPAITRMIEGWNDECMDALLLLHPVEKAIGYDGKGDFFFENGVIRRRHDNDTAPYVFTGVQLLHLRLFSGATPGVFSMNMLYNRGILPDGTLPRIGGIIHDGDWLHVGDPSGLALAQQWFADRS